MIGWFLFGICLVTGLYLIGSWFINANPKSIAKTLRYVAAGIVGAVVLMLIVSGRFGLGMALAPLIFLCLGLFRPRLFSGGFPRFTQAKTTPGQSTDVKTDYIDMSLDLDSGVIHGKVRKGRFAGKIFADLSREQLVALWQECQTADPEAAQLVEAYLDRTVGPEWRDGFGHEGSSEDGPAGGNSRAAGSGEMTREEAFEILGLSTGAGPAEIREAYRRLMQQYHPDSGGSTYLAAKINQAKDLLLGRGKQDYSSGRR